MPILAKIDRLKRELQEKPTTGPNGARKKGGGKARAVPRPYGCRIYRLHGCRGPYSTGGDLGEGGSQQGKQL